MAVIRRYFTQADVDVLKDVLMFRENKLQFILTHDGMETVVRVSHLHRVEFVLGLFLYT